MDDEVDRPARPPVMDYRGTRSDAGEPRSAVPSVDWWVLLVAHGVLALIGGLFSLVALPALMIGLGNPQGGAGPGLLCGCLPAAIGIPCLFVGGRGLYRLGRNDDPTWGRRR